MHVRYDAVLSPIISIVQSPGRPIISVPEPTVCMETTSVATLAEPRGEQNTIFNGANLGL